MLPMKSRAAIIGICCLLAGGLSACTKAAPCNCQQGPNLPTLSSSDRQDLLANYLCPQAAREDQNTAGIRSTGRPWTLADLIIDISTPYATDKLKSSDLALARLSVAASVKPEPQSISLGELCARAGHPVTTKNQSMDEPLAAVVAVASILGEEAAQPTPPPQAAPQSQATSH